MAFPRLSCAAAVAVLVCLELVAFAPPAAADDVDPPADSLSLDDAIALALKRHPSLRAAAAREEVARDQVDEARAHELPDGGISAQLNRSTSNAVPGAFFPTVGIVSISGSQRGRSLSGSVWESGTALWLDWNATGMAQKGALVDAALEGVAESEADLRATQLEIEYEVSDAFLSVLAADEGVRAASANVDRARTFATVVDTLVTQNLRPGADAARVQADVSLALTQLARAEQARAVSAARLGELIGTPGQAVKLKPGGLLRPVGNAPPFATSVATQTHPLVEQRAAQAARARALERAARYDFWPRVDLLASFWARGSALYPGGFTAASGAVPDTPNWAAGAVFSWPLLDTPILRARSRAARAETEAALARRDEAALAVSSQFAQALALLEGARRVAQDTPVALRSAQIAETQALARYRASLSSIVDVADAERVLAQAELEEALARLEVRRAILLLARASGDLEPFFQDARGGAGPR